VNQRVSLGADGLFVWGAEGIRFDGLLMENIGLPHLCLSLKKPASAGPPCTRIVGSAGHDVVFNRVRADRTAPLSLRRAGDGADGICFGFRRHQRLALQEGRNDT